MSMLGSSHRYFFVSYIYIHNCIHICIYNNNNNNDNNNNISHIYTTRTNVMLLDPFQ